MKQLKIGQVWETRNGITVTIVNQDGSSLYPWTVETCEKKVYSYANSGTFWHDDSQPSGFDLCRLISDPSDAPAPQTEKHTMKPFNLQEALAGKPICDRQGRPCKVLAYEPALKGAYKLVALCADNTLNTFTDAGRSYHPVASDKDLFMVTTKKTVWLNIYPGAYEASVHATEETADFVAAPSRIGGKAYPVEIDE